MTEPLRPESRDYRDTVFLPKTDFPMKAGLPQKEPGILARWLDADLYRQLRDARAGREKFILHDGPPYANGDMHIGHALNHILKDMVCRTQNLLGKDAPYFHGKKCDPAARTMTFGLCRRAEATHRSPCRNDERRREAGVREAFAMQRGGGISRPTGPAQRGRSRGRGRTPFPAPWRSCRRDPATTASARPTASRDRRRTTAATGSGPAGSSR